MKMSVEEKRRRNSLRKYNKYWNILKKDKKLFREHSEYITNAVRKWRDENPEKVSAHRAVFTAKRNGSLKPNPCFCGNKKVEAHHENYTKPLDVMWLCKKHHKEYDMKRRNRLSTATPLAIQKQ